MASQESLARYQLLAHAIAGRRVGIALASPGAPPFTNGRTVYVSRDGGSGRHLVEVVLQASLLGAGSLDVEILRVLVGRRRLARRYLAAEGPRALRSTLWDFRGLVPLLRQLAGMSCETSSPAESLACALSRRPLAEPPPEFGVIHPRRVLAAARALERTVGDIAAPESPEIVPPAGRSGDEEKRADEVSRVLAALLPREGAMSDKGAGARPDELEPDRQRGRPGLLGRLVGNLVRGQALLPRMLRRLQHPTPEEGQAGVLLELPRGALRVQTTSRQRRAVWLAPKRIAPAPEPLEYEAGRYPEWDDELRSYRPRWCRVTEILASAEGAPESWPPEDRALRRRLTRLGLGLERRRRQNQGEDIDLDALVESRVQLAARSIPDENIYIESQRRRRDLAVLVLIDTSGSTRESGVSGTTVHERQRAAAASLIQTLHLLGDHVSSYAFHSYGRSAVRMIRIKSLAEPFDTRVVARLAGLQPRGFTRLGAAIRHATRVLVRDSGASRRLLLVLSDGIPYDHHRYEGPYAEADGRRALEEAREQGLACLCLSMGSERSTESLRHVFGSSAYARAESLDDLWDVIGPLLRNALRSAEGPRRPRRSSPMDARAAQAPGVGA